ncbi:hypothetical protein [Bacteroides sp.]|uniref:hypothetical protein n=1 Tax=Bacteroides sp. TaxID=29523 RepID=UPI002A82AC6E|nr:hypothetical protein [Bacteroides sp.]
MWLLLQEGMVFGKKIDCIQWLLLISISLGRYVEVAFLFLLLFTYRWYKFKKIAIFFSLLLIHFCVTNYFIGYPVGKFVQQFFILLLLVVSYYQFFRNYVPNIEILWDKYIRLCLFLSYFGLLQLAVYILTNIDISFFVSLIDGAPQQSYRLRSYFLEPGSFATFIIPAVSYCFLKKGYWKQYKSRVLILVIALLLTFATIGYFVMCFFILYRYRRIILKYCYFLVVPIIVFFLYILNYSAREDGMEGSWKAMMAKTSESINAFSDFEPEYFEVLNLSTYALLTNLWVANEAPYRLTGTGLGTHEINYEAEYQSDFVFYGLNQTDAYSLFTRLYSEFGIIGVFLAIYLLFRYRNSKDPINIAILLVFISYFIRGGHYFLYGVVFYAYLFYNTSSDRNKCLKI